MMKNKDNPSYKKRKRANQIYLTLIDKIIKYYLFV